MTVAALPPAPRPPQPGKENFVMSQNVYVLGAAMTKFGKHLDKSIKDLTGLALDQVLMDCSLTRGDLQAAWFSNSAWGILTTQHVIRGQVALSANGLEGLPIINVENACAGGSTAFQSAYLAVKAGQYDCALAIGVEKTYDQDREKVMSIFLSGLDVEVGPGELRRQSEESRKKREEEARAQGLEPPAETGGGHSIFMDYYAGKARRHMDKYGTTQRQLAAAASKSHGNSVLNPLAQYTFPVSVEEALHDREVVWPLTRSMCAPIGDGGAAAILCSESFLKKTGRGRAVKVLAAVMQSGNRFTETDIAARAARLGYEAAGVGPEDIDVAEVHDATSFAELYLTEQMGFCPLGEGGVLAESGATALNGKIPVNPSGGLVSRGHPIGASGLAMIYELTTQLRGEAGARQVNHPRLALINNGGGNIGGGDAAMCQTILEKVT